MWRFGIVLAVSAAAFAQAPGQGSQTEREKLSDMGMRVIQKASEAKAAIDKKDKDLAAQRVREGLLNVTAIETENPRKPPANVTLYTERVEFTVAQQVKPGESIGSANRSAAEAPGQLVRDAEGESTRVWLDVAAARRDLQAAQSAIGRGDMAAASSALTAVSSKDVHAQSVDADLPLLKARRNLAIALDDVHRQQYQQAAAPLQAASSALAEYAGGKGAHARDAATLHGQVDGLAKNIGQHPANAESEIGKWWNQVSDWFTPLAPPAK